MKTTVHYSRKKDSKGYQVVEVASGKLLAQFGSGPAEKYLAERIQLQMEYPEVLRAADRIVARYPELRKRALKAAVLYDVGHVHVNGAEHSYDVDSQTEGDMAYRVDLQYSTCSCPDFEGALLGRNHSAPWCNDQPICKHIVAAHLFEMLS